MSFKMPVYTAPDFSQQAYKDMPNARWIPAPANGVAPDDYHATTIFPEYFKINGSWQLARESRMDCVAVLIRGVIEVKEFRRLKKGDLVAVGRSEDGSNGIYVHATAFTQPESQGEESFAFRQGRSRETAYAMDYDSIYDLLRYEKEHGGHITWVLGPACCFDWDARHAFAKLVHGGYVQAVLAGNALATHDLEAGYRSTALGQDIYTQISQPGGHYNHIDTINQVRKAGSIEKFVAEQNIQDGIMAACVQCKVPYVLTGSIRDDGPLPEVYADVYEGQNAMRDQVKKSTTVICLATTLHSIATGNMTPSYRVLADGTVRPVYFYSVDVSEFAVNKLRDRGSLAVKTIVTNVQDFIVNVQRGLSL